MGLPRSCYFPCNISNSFEKGKISKNMLKTICFFLFQTFSKQTCNCVWKLKNGSQLFFALNMSYEQKKPRKFQADFKI
jgi:hypothetical protein